MLFLDQYKLTNILKDSNYKIGAVAKLKFQSKVKNK